MKKMIYLLLVTISSMAAASTAEDIKNARTGDLFALKENVVFPAGVNEVKLYESPFSVEGRKFVLSCSLLRQEEGQECGNYQKVIVRANKYRLISLVTRWYSDYSFGIWSRPQQKNAKCSAHLVFHCEAYRSDDNFDGFKLKSSKDLLNDELKYQGSRLISVKADDSTPGEWP